MTGDAAVSAINDVEVKATADGSSEAHQAADELFALMMDDDGSEPAADPDVGGTLGIGASVAVATHKNTTTAKFASTAQFIGADNPDSLSVTAEQSSVRKQDPKLRGLALSLLCRWHLSRWHNHAQATIAAGANTITTKAISLYPRSRL